MCVLVIMEEQLTRKQKYYRENAERLRQESREYYHNNKEQELERRKKWYEQNKQYREEHKQEITEKSKVKMICECGRELRKSHLNRHLKTDIHKQLMEQQTK